MQNSVKILEIFPSMLGSQTESTDIEQIVSRAWDKPGVFKLTWRLSTNLPNWGSPSLLVDLDSWTLTTTKKTSTVRSRLRCCLFHLFSVLICNVNMTYRMTSNLAKNLRFSIFGVKIYITYVNYYTYKFSFNKSVIFLFSILFFLLDIE